MKAALDKTIDPLEFFLSLEKRSTPKEEVGDKTYPGSTPPRNKDKTLDLGPLDWLNRLPSQEFLVGSTLTKFYSIGALAAALGKTPVTLRSWERKGWLPPATFRTPPPANVQLPDKASKGKRLYSQDQVVFLAEAYEKYILNPRKPNWDGFRRRIKTNYPR